MQASLERVCKNYPKAFSLVIGDGLCLNEKIFKLLESYHKKTIAVLKEERRQLFEKTKVFLIRKKSRIFILKTFI